MSNVFIRSLHVDGVAIHLEGDQFHIVVLDVEEIKAEKQADGTWVLWDTGEYIGIFENFQQIWSHVEDLASYYRLFSSEWQAQHYAMLCTLFRGVK